MLESRHSDARQVASSSAIGPLLDATLVSALNCFEVGPAAALLDALLRAIRAEDSVVLTGDQRIYLHELVSPGRWWTWTRAYPKACGNAMVEGLRRELRPAAIGALGSLGDGSSVSVLEQFARTTSDPDLRHSALHSVDQIRQRLQNSSPQQWGEKVER